MRIKMKSPEIIVERDGCLTFGTPSETRVSPWFDFQSFDLIGNISDCSAFVEGEVPFSVYVLPQEENDIPVKLKVEKCFVMVGSIPRFVISKDQILPASRADFLQLKNACIKYFS